MAFFPGVRDQASALSRVPIDVPPRPQPGGGPGSLAFNFSGGARLNPATRRPASMTGNIADPEYGGVRAGEFQQSTPGEAPAEMEMRELPGSVPRRTESFSPGLTGSLVDLEGRARTRHLLDQAFGRDEDLAFDPQLARYEALEKEAAVEELTPAENLPGGRPTVRGDEARDLAQEADERKREEARAGQLGQELGGLQLPEQAQVEERLMKDPRFLALDKEQQENVRRQVMQELQQRYAAERANILSRYDYLRGGDIGAYAQPQGGRPTRY